MYEYQLRILKSNISLHNVLFLASVRRFSTSSKLLSVGLFLKARYSEVLSTGSCNLFDKLAVTELLVLRLSGLTPHSLSALWASNHIYNVPTQLFLI